MVVGAESWSLDLANAFVNWVDGAKRWSW
jgi:hypothetical protein